MTAKSSKRANGVWRKLADWYGADRIERAYGIEPPQEWREFIDRTEPRSLDAALKVVRAASPVHPPTLGQLEAALPKRVAHGSSIAELLSEHAMKRLGRELCAHQVRGPWNYFAPKDAPGQISGVQIPACGGCDRPSHRVLASELVSDGVTV